MGCFSEVQADGYSSFRWGCCAESGMFSRVSSSARIAICPSVLTINTVCNASRSDMAPVPLRTLARLSALRWFRRGRP
eukprot:5510556-Pyramimonas_sp.AAC.1